MLDYLDARGPYLLFVFLPMVGVYLLLSHRNFIKAFVGLSLIQTSIILFFIMVAAREGSTIPIRWESGSHGGEAHAAAAVHDEGHAEHGADPAGGHAEPIEAPAGRRPARAPGAGADAGSHHGESPEQLLTNPLPHALMLTAIVVGVATLGVALAILRRLRAEAGSIEEPIPAGQHD